MQRKTSKTLLLGRRGENDASLYLEKKGMQIIERNFRCKIGEIDIIGLIDEFLVFVEVKSRKASNLQISPFLSMTRVKCHRLRRLGEYYRTHRHLLQKQPRFDTVGITYQDGDSFSIEHIENAF